MKIKDLLAFRCMLIPVIVQALFWVGTLLCIGVGIFGLLTNAVWMGIAVILLGPLFIRLVCEYVIVLFRINDTLTEIRNTLADRKTTS